MTITDFALTMAVVLLVGPVIALVWAKWIVWLFDKWGPY